MSSLLTEPKSSSIILSVVMPAYNEGAHIYDNLITASRVLASFVDNGAYEIIAVNDGSSDDTHNRILQAAREDSHIRAISYEKNGGKGHAIRTGIAEASGGYIAFLDSDLELPPELLKDFLYKIEQEDTDIVIGSKLHPESKLHYPVVRRIMSYGYYVMLKLLFRLKVHDTQTGIKLYKSEVIKPIAASLTTEGYAFDIEILAKAHKQGFRISEAPVELNYSRDNTSGNRRISLSDIIRVFTDTLAVRRQLK